MSFDASTISDWDYCDKNGRFSYDRFWEEKVFWAKSGDRMPDGSHAIRINGHHYVAEPRIVKSLGFMGFGGRRMSWRELSTGEVYESNNVWTQGVIPDGFQDLLPDNAEWVPTKQVTDDVMADWRKKLRVTE